jgi:hypothetical protein
VLPILIAAAEPSKTPFYIAGALLVLWAIVLGGIGLAKPDFPASDGTARLTMGITFVLMLAAIGTAVATSAFPH